MMAVQGKGLLAVWTDIPAHIEAEFNRWYDEEHLAERAGIPGFLNARRYVALQGTPKYVALYDTVDAQVLRSDAYLQVLNHATPWTQRVRPHFQNFVRNEYELILTLGTSPRRQPLSCCSSVWGYPPSTRPSSMIGIIPTTSRP
jgi:hypothetical protein